MRPHSSASLARRLSSLKLRTAAVMLLALACAALALRLGIDARLATVGPAGSAPLLPGAPPIDIPAGLRSGWFTLLQPVACVALLFALLRYSTGVRAALAARKWLLFGAGVLAASALGMSATERLLFVLPSQLDRQVLLGRFDAADMLLAGAQLHPAERSYLQAQLALRAGDRIGLRKHGAATLDLAQQAFATTAPRPPEVLVAPSQATEVCQALMEDPDGARRKYGDELLDAVQRRSPNCRLASYQAGPDYDAFDAARKFDPAVLGAIEAALAESVQTPRQGRFDARARMVAALLLLAASLGSAWVWNLMRMRVWAIHCHLLEAPSRD